MNVSAAQPTQGMAGAVPPAAAATPQDQVEQLLVSIAEISRRLDQKKELQEVCPLTTMLLLNNLDF